MCDYIDTLVSLGHLRRQTGDRAASGHRLSTILLKESSPTSAN